MPIKEAIRDFVLTNFLFCDDPSRLQDTASFLEEGIIDSTGVLELVMFVEESLGVIVEDEDIIPENFDSVDGLTRYVLRKTGKAILDARQPLPTR